MRNNQWPNSWSANPGTECSISDFLSPKSEPAKVAVALQDVMPVLASSFSQGRQWVHDFGQDKIQIPRDLYEAIEYARRLDAEGQQPN